MEHATGYYLNVYGRDLDIFVIFNEPNNIPNPEESEVIFKLVEEVIDTATIDDNTMHAFRADLEARIEQTNLQCVRFGVQVILSL